MSDAEKKIFGLDVILDEAMPPDQFKIGYPGVYMIAYENGELIVTEIKPQDFYRMPTSLTRHTTQGN